MLPHLDSCPRDFMISAQRLFVLHTCSNLEEKLEESDLNEINAELKALTTENLIQREEIQSLKMALHDLILIIFPPELLCYHTWIPAQGIY